MEFRHVLIFFCDEHSLCCNYFQAGKSNSLLNAHFTSRCAVACGAMKENTV